MAWTSSSAAILSSFALAAAGVSAQEAAAPSVVDVRVAGAGAQTVVAAIARVAEPETITLRGEDTVRKLIEARCGLVDPAYVVAFLEENGAAADLAQGAAIDGPSPGKVYRFPYCLPHRAVRVSLDTATVSDRYADLGVPFDANAIQARSRSGRRVDPRKLSSLRALGSVGNLSTFVAANKGFFATEQAYRFASDNPDITPSRMLPGEVYTASSREQSGSVPLRAGVTIAQARAAITAAAATDNSVVRVDEGTVAELITDFEQTPEQCPGADGNPDWPLSVAAFRRALEANDAARGTRRPEARTVLVVDTGYYLGMGAPAIPPTRLGTMRSADGQSLPIFHGVNTARRIDDAAPPDGLAHATHGGEVAATLLGGQFLPVDRDEFDLPKVVFASVAQRSGTGPYLDVNAIGPAYRSAVDSDIRVINASIAAPSQRTAFLDAIKAMSGQSLLVTAAGNVTAPPQRFGGSEPPWPGSLGGNPLSATPAVVISVGAHDPLGVLLPFSRTGSDNVDLLAPGCRIRTYGFDPATSAVIKVVRSGTSYAAPIVAMVASQLSAEGLRPVAIKDRLIISVDMDERLHDEVWSGGRLNAPRALSIFRDVLVYRVHGVGGAVETRTVEGLLRNENELVTICGDQIPLGDLRKFARSEDPTQPAIARWRGWRKFGASGAATTIRPTRDCPISTAQQGGIVMGIVGGADLDPVPLGDVIDFVARFKAN